MKLPFFPIIISFVLTAPSGKANFQHKIPSGNELSIKLEAALRIVHKKKQGARVFSQIVQPVLGEIDLAVAPESDSFRRKLLTIKKMPHSNDTQANLRNARLHRYLMGMRTEVSGLIGEAIALREFSSKPEISGTYILHDLDKDLQRDPQKRLERPAPDALSFDISSGAPILQGVLEVKMSNRIGLSDVMEQLEKVFDWYKRPRNSLNINGNIYESLELDVRLPDGRVRKLKSLSLLEFLSISTVYVAKRPSLSDQSAVFRRVVSLPSITNLYLLRASVELLLINQLSKEFRLIAYKFIDFEASKKRGYRYQSAVCSISARNTNH